MNQLNVWRLLYRLPIHRNNPSGDVSVRWWPATAHDQVSFEQLSMSSFASRDCSSVCFMETQALEANPRFWPKAAVAASIKRPFNRATLGQIPSDRVV